MLVPVLVVVVRRRTVLVLYKVAERLDTVVAVLVVVVRRGTVL